MPYNGVEDGLKEPRYNQGYLGNIVISLVSKISLRQALSVLDNVIQPRNFELPDGAKITKKRVKHIRNTGIHQQNTSCLPKAW